MSSFRGARVGAAQLLLVFLVTGCSEGESGSSARQAVSLAFSAQAGEAPFDCDNHAVQMGVSADQTVELRDFRLFVGNARLLTAGGEEVSLRLDSNAWQLQTGEGSVALLDFVNREDGCAGDLRARRLVVTGTVPAGEYTGVAFELGVPAVLNHRVDGAAVPAPLNLPEMQWAWQSGHKFLKLETGYLNGALQARNQVLHTGSTGCVGGSADDPFAVVCEKQYRPEIRLEPFNAATDTIVADVRALFADTDLEAASLVCMPGSAPECVALVEKLGVDADGRSTGTQSFFRVE